jgi:hypothetical protein
MSNLLIVVFIASLFDVQTAKAEGGRSGSPPSPR